MHMKKIMRINQNKPLMHNFMMYYSVVLCDTCANNFFFFMQLSPDSHSLHEIVVN